MEVQRERPPAYGQEPDTLNLPSVPTHDLSPPTTHAALNLPELRSLGLPDSHPNHPQSQASAEKRGAKWQKGLLPVTAFPSVPSGALRQSVEMPLYSPKSDFGTSVDEHVNRSQSVMSMDDAETRAAAEALSGLRNPDFMRSPSTRSTTISIPQPNLSAVSASGDGDVEPLLSLVTSNHPWIGGTINGSLSAYNTTKNYSPAFVRSSAEFVERNITSPVASTFATVSRRTGVEGGIRRYLGERRPSDVDRDASRKRRRLRETSPEADIEQGLQSPTFPNSRRSRAGSQASFAESMVSLPPYDENRSPRYEETAPLLLQERPEPPQTPTRNWRTQLMITTSGLGAALSETSLRNLRLCLKLLRGATDSLTTTMYAIKQLIADYEQSTQGTANTNESDGQQSSAHVLTPEQEEASRQVAERIKAFHREIMQTLESVKNSISHYTGGALPENAGALVRRQLMSIPQRWRVAETTADSNATTTNEAVKSGNRLSVFAGQSLDMIAQVTLIVSATIENAEGWLERMGKKKQDRAGSVVDGSPSGQVKTEKGDEREEREDIGMSEKR